MRINKTLKISIIDQRIIGQLIPAAKRNFSMVESTLEDKIRAAAEAGYDGVGLREEDIEEYFRQRHTMKDIGLLLEEYAIPVNEVDFDSGWQYSRGKSRIIAFEKARKCFMYASFLGCNLTVAVASPDKGDITQAIKDFRELCNLAGSFEINVALEAQGFAKQINNLKVAQRILEKARCPNGGIVLDTYHFYRGGSSLKDLQSFPTEKILLVHLCDSPKEWTSLNDWDRLFIGEGVVPFKEIVNILNSKGYNGYFSLEILNTKHWGRDPCEVAKIAKRTMQNLLGS